MERISGIVLAGGDSSRMGRDKAAIVLGGRTLLQRAVDAVAEVADEVIVVLAPGAPHPALEARTAVRFTADSVPGQGPLVGVLAGLEVTTADIALVVACDLPFVQPALLRLLAQHAVSSAAVVPMVDGRPQPMCCAIRTSARTALRSAFEAGARAAAAIADLEGALLLEPAVWRSVDAEGLSFLGANTPADLEQCARLAVRLG